ncbi:MAG: multidrug efflux RND transporter permease subunit [Deltaproteobacteria bacterium]|nr:multidrug efflux RND transporter permease subunit [Deltaproteobacteria bacterium]
MISRLFIERPRLAGVVSIVITLGLIALLNIPVAQYPEISPPEIRVSAFYPGADAQTVADSVAAPIEAEVNGVENMLYMSSTCSNNGGYGLTVTFAVGTDPDVDQVNLQNRVQQAITRLPKEVVDQGVTVRRRSSDMLCVVNYFSPKGTRDKLFLSNYVSRNVSDALVRISGVSDVQIFGEMEYSMRVWLNPDRLVALGLTPQDVLEAIRNQNVQAAVGSIGTSPAVKNQQLQYILRAKGRLENPASFENIIIRSGSQGALVRLRDVGRVELGARSYATTSFLNGAPALGVAVYRSAGANALDTMKAVRSELKRMEPRLPSDVRYTIAYDTTTYVRAAIGEIEFTLFLTFFLVVGVTFLFLQNWRATLIPTITIPVSLIGTFAVLMALGYSANTISLFALIMAIGLVVDDAIVVVENTHRIMEEEGLTSKEAAIKSMQQVTGPVIATTLVLLAVFAPVGFVPGISGQLYKQFAVTISTSVLISSINALTLSPALCAVFLKPGSPFRRGPFAWFNKALSGVRNIYAATAGWLIRRLAVALLLLAAVFASTYYLFERTPRSFIPREDQGAFFFNVQLADRASLNLTNRVMARIYQEVKGINGIQNFLGITGFSLLSGTGENVGFGIGVLATWDERTSPQTSIDAIVGQVQRKLGAMSSARILTFVPPPIRGLGRTGGFDFRLQALRGQSPQEMAAAARALVVAANRDPRLSRVFTTYRASTPQIYVDLDRTKAEVMGIPVSRVYRTLQAYLGSAYANDFNLFGRVYQVKVQADAPFRSIREDIMRLYVKNNEGHMVPLRELVRLSTVLGPQQVYRYNQFPSVQINGQAAPGVSSTEAMSIMEKIASETLPEGYSFDWSTMSFQERKAKGQVATLFALALVFGYLFLVAQYESWTIPLPIIISIPVATLGGLAGIWIAGLDLSIYAQIGLVMLVGLASKNAILIVEFAKDRRNQGIPIAQAAVEGAKTRFRPVLMTALTFIMGVAPMVIATGAGAASRRHIGTAVFSGMLAATLVGIFLVPPMYYAFQSMRERWKRG